MVHTRTQRRTCSPSRVGWLGREGNVDRVVDEDAIHLGLWAACYTVDFYSLRTFFFLSLSLLPLALLSFFFIRFCCVMFAKCVCGVGRGTRNSLLMMCSTTDASAPPTQRKRGDYCLTTTFSLTRRFFLRLGFRFFFVANGRAVVVCVGVYPL